MKMLIPAYLKHFNGSTVRIILKNAGRYRLHGLASEMAYSSMLALFPLILTVFTAVGFFSSSSQQTFQLIMDQLRQVAPQEALVLMDGYVRDISYSQNGGLLSVSFLGTIWAASGSVSAAMAALDLSHEVSERKRRHFWQSRGLSLVLMFGILALVGMACYLMFFSDIVLRLLATQAGSVGLDPLSTLMLWIWNLLKLPIVLGVITLACMVLYRYGPSQRNRVIPLLPGAVGASLLWVATSVLFRGYVSHFGNYNRVYGTVGAVVVLLLWLWLSSLAVLMGEQLNIALFQSMQIKKNS